MYEKKLPKTDCPECGSPNDCATQVQGRDIMPSPGDYCVCIECGAILCYDESMHVFKLTQTEIDSIDDRNREAVLKLQHTVHYFAALRTTQGKGKA